MSQQLPSRRGLITAAAAAALVPRFAAAGAPSGQFVATTFRVPKGSITLALHRKRLAPSSARQARAPVLLLLHGSTFGAMTSFDLTVPGKSGYSMMDEFAGQGFDVWALDFDGYGSSGWSGGNSDIEASLGDLAAAVPVIERETGRSRFHVYGQSSGALRAGRFAMMQPERIDHMVFESFTWTGVGSPTLVARRRNVDAYRASPRRPRTRESIADIFTRDHAESFEPGVMEATIRAELPFGDSVPSGTFLDMSTRLPLVDPLKLPSPVMIARGEYDGIATQDDLLTFFSRLPHPTKAYVGVAGAAHGVVSSRHRAVLFRAVSAFLPPAV